jgi:hypothetical protein
MVKNNKNGTRFVPRLGGKDALIPDRANALPIPALPRSAFAW